MRIHVARLLALVLLACPAGCGKRSESSEKGGPGTATFMAVGAPGRRPTTLGHAKDGQVPTGRLPRDVVPLAYRLGLTVVPTRKRFEGKVQIALQLRKKLKSFWMHGRGLTVSSAVLVVRGHEPLNVSYAEVHPAGVARVKLPRAVGPGRAELHLTYSAPFAHRLTGLHVVRDGKESYVYTDFEPTDARRCFPGFDEPGFKATFQISLTVRREHVALANTRKIGEDRLAGGMKRVRFARTEKLPTYLVAMAAGPFDVVKVTMPPNEVRKRALQLRGIAPRGKGKRLAYALKETPGILVTQERYFGSPYPFDKLDLIAVPGQGGAMENPGLITFGETLLLLDAGRAPERQRRRFAGVMAHELAHMWFGDLVTMRWWNDTWLNESFASWMAYRTLQLWRPGQGAGLHFAGSMRTAFRSDSLAAARRIRQPIRNAHDIRNAFDRITYNKGSAVLGMFERYAGVKRFRRGVRDYLEKFRHGTATGQDFLTTLSAAAGKGIATAFRTFLDQPGLPLLGVQQACRGKRAEVTLTQSRYLPLGSKASGKVLWKIPVCFKFGRAGKVRRACTLLTERQQTWKLPGAGCTDWVFPNAGGNGYYRFTLQPTDLLALRTRGLARLNPRERFMFADSIEAAWRAGRLGLRATLEALEPFASDREPGAARVLLRVLRFVRTRILTPQERHGWDAYGRRLFGPVLKRLGLTTVPTTGERKLLRGAVARFLAEHASDAELRKTLLKWGRAYLQSLAEGKADAKAVDPDLAGLALEVATQEDGAPTYQAAAMLLRKSRNALVRRRLIRAIGSVTDPKLAARSRKMMFAPGLRMMERFGLMMSQGRHPENRQALWKWVKARWPLLMKFAPPQAAGYIILGFGALCSARHRREVADFFRPQIDRYPGAPRRLRATLERISLCSALAKKNHAAALAFAKGA